MGLAVFRGNELQRRNGNRAHVNVDDVFRDETRAAFESSSFPICIWDEGSDQDCPSLRRRPSMVTVRKPKGQYVQEFAGECYRYLEVSNKAHCPFVISMLRETGEGNSATELQLR